MDNSLNNHEYIDLGLSVMWATCNLGATTAEGFGEYHPWEEADSIKTWGDGWRLPTIDELHELTEQCSCTWCKQNGVKGIKAEAPNGNSIFLPAAGYMCDDVFRKGGEYGHYWSSTPTEKCNHAMEYFFKSKQQELWAVGTKYGFSIRLVCKR